MKSSDTKKMIGSDTMGNGPWRLLFDGNNVRFLIPGKEYQFYAAEPRRVGCKVKNHGLILENGE